MPFTVPDAASAAFADQARLFSSSIDAIVAGENLTGVQSGCAVAAQTSPDMTVAVAAGIVRISGRGVIVAAGNVTITTANATNPRIDLITVDTSGTKAAVAGTAATTPLEPAIPAGRVAIAQVYVPANDTTMNTNQIVDRRVLVSNMAFENLKWYGVQGDGKKVTDGAMTSGSATLTSATAGFSAADVGKKVMVSAATSTVMRLAGKITAFNSATSVTVSVPARVTGTGLTMVLDGLTSRTVADAATTNDSTTVTSATMAFTANDVGKTFWITTAGRSALNTTITGFTNSTTVTLGTTATRTCSAVQVVYGTDDTLAMITWMAALATDGLSGRGYVPAGLYLCTPSNVGNGGTNQVTIPSNVHIFGDGWDSIIRSTGAENAAVRSFEMWGVNTGSSGSADPTTNVNNIILENLHFQGTTLEEDFLENGSNLLSLNAVSDVIIRNCKFSYSRSDGLYLGSGTTGPTLERHNERIRVENCLFDGGNTMNRNCISIIDGTDVAIDRCAFMDWTRDDMPGAIDSEPNDNTFSRIRGIRITNCSFTGIGGNQAVASIYSNTPQENHTTPINGWIFANNFVYNCLSSTLGILLRSPTFPDENCPRHNVEVVNNIFRGRTVDGTGLLYCLDFEGVRGAFIRGNIWHVTQQSMIFGYNYKCLDVDIEDNVFMDVGSAGGKAIELVRGDRINISENTFDHVSPLTSGGYILRFVNGGAATTPNAPTLTPSTTGGTLAAGTKSYRISAYMDNGETVAGTATTVATTGTTSSVLVSWTKVYGVKGYKVYGRTSGSELLMATLVGVNANSFTDTGSVTPAGALPTATSDRGATNGVGFRNNVIRQGATNNTGQISNLVANHVTVTNALQYYGNSVPNNATLAISPFVDSTISYVNTAATLVVDASLVPPNGTIAIATNATNMTTLTVSNPTPGQVINIEYTITATSQVYAFPAGAKHAAATAPTKSTTAGRKDIMTYRYDGANWCEIGRSLNVG